MNVFIYAGISAGLALLITRKNGPYNVFKYIRRLGPTVRCSVCTAFLVSMLTFAFYLVAFQGAFVVEEFLRALSSIGWAYALLAIMGALDLDAVVQE